MILERTVTRSGVVLLRFECSGSKPGQCASVGGKYFVIARCMGSIATVITWSGSPIDVPAGTRIDLVAPVGPGYDTSGSDPVIVTGGLGFAAGLSLAQSFRQEGRSFRMLSFTRSPDAVYDCMEQFGLSPDDRVRVWNTSAQGRPGTPLDPLDVPISEETPLFFAGPRSLHDGLRSALDKSGRSDVRIRLNY